MVELTSSFKLEFDALDRDHQQLAETVNRIVQALDQGKAGECERLVTDFVRDAKKHFAHEEGLLAKAGYPNAKKHRDHHRSLNTQMDHMVEFARMAEENPMAQEKLRKELVYFLMDDVITADMDFKNFLGEKMGSPDA